MVREARASYAELCAQLDALSPLRVLERGYPIAVVDTDGCVLGGEIVRNSNDYWTELAFATMRRHVFEPARDGETPIKAFVTLRFDYPNPFQ